MATSASPVEQPQKLTTRWLLKSLESDGRIDAKARAKAEVLASGHADDPITAVASLSLIHI